MTGAPVLACRAAMRSGVGLVYCATPELLHALIAGRLVEELTLVLPSDRGDCFDLNSVTPLVSQAVRMKAIALGPGLGRADETQRFARHIIEECTQPMIIDADALNALGGHMDILHSRGGPTVLTPHPGEMSRLTGLSVSDVQADRIGIARRVAQEFRVVVLLKGAQTVIADAEGEVYLNPTGNTGLAKGGSGDVLTGLVGGLLAQKCTPLAAAACGAFLHGLAADLAADSIPPRAMIGSDVIDHLPQAFEFVMQE
jgi:NAD(P)H-hydrate epimerase